MSRLIRVEDVILAYDDALLEWEKQMLKVFIPLNLALGTSRSLGSYSFSASAWDAKRFDRDFDTWSFLLRVLAIGGAGPEIWIAPPEAPFTLRGPYRANLRNLLEQTLPGFALSQNSMRKYQVKHGQFRTR